MLKFSKIISSKSKNIVKENSEYFRNILFVEMKFSKFIYLFDGDVLKWPRYYMVSFFPIVCYRAHPSGFC